MSFSDLWPRGLVPTVLLLWVLTPGEGAAGQTSPPGALTPRALPGVVEPTAWGRFGSDASPDPDAGLEVVGFRQETQQNPPVGPGRAFLSSALVPGLGQYQQGRRRWVAYLGAEVAFAWLHLARKSDARDLRGRYRDLAWEVARGGGPSDLRADGDFVYYETLSKWTRSGAFDQEPSTPGTTPETDPGTFNGSIWALAAEIFDLDPENPTASPGYAGAVAYYEERAYGSAFLWDWGSDPASQARFGDLIVDSDRKFRSAREALGLLLANHLVSALDGFVTARVHAVSDSRFLFEARVPLGR